MSTHSTHAIRNLALTGSAGTGKTTLVEAMLHAAGVIGRVGRVEDGNTFCDYDELEKEFGHSLDSTLVYFGHSDAHINLIDTPGSPDFIGRAMSVLPAVETCAIVIDAAAGIETITRRMMKLADERNIPRLIVINKIDTGDDLAALLEQIQETFGSICQPINLPADGGAKVVDCFQNNTGSSDLGDVSTFHTGIVDQVVETDEALMEKYLESGEVSPEELHEPFEKALRDAHLIPICFASARQNVGVSELMDVIASLCPNPLEGNPRPFERVRDSGDIEAWTPTPDSDQPLVAHVFKVSSDPFVGKLSYFRVHQGRLKADTQPRVDDHKKPVRVSHVFKVRGKQTEETAELVAGDIGAVSKIDEINYNSVLHASEEDHGLRLKHLPLPRPMYGLAIEGTSKGAESKMSEALTKLTAEDPTLEIERVQSTGETVLRGLGEQHLRAKLRMLKDRYGIEVETKPPRVAYKETITGNAEGHHRHKKQTGGAGQFGEVYLRIEPLNGDEDGVVDGLLFVDDTFGGSIPKQFMPAIEKGIRQVMAEGAIAGYPMQDVKVSVYDGKHHPVDSKEVAFITAGKKAFVDAVQKASPVLLEPFVAMEITVAADMIGDITSDISGKRGRVQGTDMLPGNQAIVSAQVPLSEVMTYASQLKSMTGGAGSYTMEYSHDEPAPPNIQAEIVAQFKPTHDED